MLQKTSALGIIWFVAAFVLVACSSGGDDGPTTPPPPTTGTVSASVQDETGSNIQGAIVELAGASTLTATTGVTGTATFTLVPAGNWQADVTPPAGFVKDPTQAFPVPVVVTAAQTTSVTLGLQEIPPTTGAVAGSVFNGSSGVPGVTIELTAPGGGGAAMITTTTDASGAYSFSELDPGDYTLTVTPSAGFGLATGQDAMVDAPVVAGESVTVDFQVTPLNPVPETVINLVNFAFEGPSQSNTVTIPVGATVRWVQTTSTFHTVTPQGHSQWTSRDMPSGAPDLVVTFNQPGTFPFFCTPHQASGMTGTIIVQ